MTADDLVVTSRFVCDPSGWSRRRLKGPSPTRPNGIETGWTGSWSAWPACCLSPRRSPPLWTNCPSSAWVSATWEPRTSSLVSPPSSTVSTARYDSSMLWLDGPFSRLRGAFSWCFQIILPQQDCTIISCIFIWLVLGRLFCITTVTWTLWSLLSHKLVCCLWDGHVPEFPPLSHSGLLLPPLFRPVNEATKKKTKTSLLGQEVLYSWTGRSRSCSIKQLVWMQVNQCVRVKSSTWILWTKEKKLHTTHKLNQCDVTLATAVTSR